MEHFIIFLMALGALCAIATFWHLHLFAYIEKQYSNTTLVRNLKVTNYLPSLQASYRKITFKMIFVLCSNGILAMIIDGLMAGSLNNNLWIVMFTGVVSVITAHLVYRLTLNHQILNKTIKICAEEAAST